MPLLKERSVSQIVHAPLSIRDWHPLYWRDILAARGGWTFESTKAKLLDIRISEINSWKMNRTGMLW